MAYTALETMRIENLKRFNQNVGPFQPDKHFTEPKRGQKETKCDLKSAALRFLHNRCEGLKFDSNKEALEKEKGEYYGKSKQANQIPYNMQMDINRLCMERELERFIDSGVAEDAYNVYYCYMEIFFGHYGRSKKMVELLSEFESNGSSLLMKHRDHYAHSVYVFALGLAIYETNALFRAAFKKFYRFDTDEKNAAADHEAANCFLEYWGLTSLFHDIGYPFELPFEQVLSYFEVDHKKRGKGSVFLAYEDVAALTKIDDEIRQHFDELFREESGGRTFRDTNELFAFDITKKLRKYYNVPEELRKNYHDFTEEYLLGVLQDKPHKPEAFHYYMDHAWFSATRLFQELVRPDVRTIRHEGAADEIEKEYVNHQKIGKKHIDALTAILLHNSLFKFSVAYYKDVDESGKKCFPALEMDWHPLAYMLMLCDELQCWDRTAYGRNSRSELHPMDAEFNFADNNIQVTYIYDAEETDKIDRYKDKYKAYLEKCIEAIRNKTDMPEPPKLKAYGSMYESEQSFRTDIEKIVAINGSSGIEFTVAVRTALIDHASKRIYLSSSNFLHLYDFAVSLHSRDYLDCEENADTEEMEKKFEVMSLEYKLSNINRAKNFGKYLNAINCFYTDKPVDFAIVHAFTPEQTAVFAPMEHERWIREHGWMGWKCGTFYESQEALTAVAPKYKAGDLREQLRMHKLTMDGNPTAEDIKKHYDALPEREQDKDWKPFNSMLKLIKKYDGLRIYRLSP